MGSQDLQDSSLILIPASTIWIAVAVPAIYGTTQEETTSTLKSSQKLLNSSFVPQSLKIYLRIVMEHETTKFTKT